MPSLAQIQAATLNKFIEGWKGSTPESWTATWSDECQQKILPFNLGVPSKSRAEAQAALPDLLGVLKNFKLEIYQIVHDSDRGKAAIYATSHADTPFGDFKWSNEYAVFITFSADGEKIDNMEEMIDTAFYREFFPKFQKYLSEKRALE